MVPVPVRGGEPLAELRVGRGRPLEQEGADRRRRRRRCGGEGRRQGRQGDRRLGPHCVGLARGELTCCHIFTFTVFSLLSLLAVVL